MQEIIELLYQYQQSKAYTVHLVLVIVMGAYMLWMALQEWRVRNKAYQFKQQSANKKMSVEKYNQETEENTADEVRKLRQSEEYRRYLEEKNRPNSHYNRHIEV